MRRTPGELRILVDAAQIVVAVAFLIDLALPWWTRADWQYPPTGTWTGWGSLVSGGAFNPTWGAIVAMLVIAVAALLRIRWVSLPAGAVSMLLALLLAVSVNREHGFGPHVFDPHAGLWVGLLLVAFGAGLCFATATLSRHAAWGREPVQR